MFNKGSVIDDIVFYVVFYRRNCGLKPFIILSAKWDLMVKQALTMVGPKDYKDHKTVLIVFKANGMNFSDEEDIYVDPVDV